jgi:hypothetical protein
LLSSDKVKRLSRKGKAREVQSVHISTE